MKNLSIILMCALAALANLGKADIISAQELPNGRIIVHNDENTAIGSGEEQVKTPWMIVSPDGTRGFANDFTTNAISLVSEDGTNFYAHVEGVREVNGELQPDRTKVIQFTVNKDGIPSKTGEEDTTERDGAPGKLHDMKNRKLIVVKDGYLNFLGINDDNKFEVFSFPSDKSPEVFQKVTAFSQNEAYFYILTQKKIGNIMRTLLNKSDGREFCPFHPYTDALTSDYNALTVMKDKNSNDEEAIESYIGNANGEICKNLSEPVATLPGPISGLSNNGDEVFATSTETNAFYNVTAGQYNVAKDEDGNLKQMVPKTKEGLLRVIDNRKKNGKFLCVTAKGIHAIE